MDQLVEHLTIMLSRLRIRPSSDHGKLGQFLGALPSGMIQGCGLFSDGRQRYLTMCRYISECWEKIVQGAS
jgi:hypothetical protein